MQPEVESICHSTCNKYATLRFVTDPGREISIPVGVALWGDSGDSLRLRLPSLDEKFEGTSSAKILPYVQHVESQIRSWIRDEKLPYQKAPLEPLSDEWWLHLRKLLRARVLVDEPKPIECMKPEQEIEALFEAVAKPRQVVKQSQNRLLRAFNTSVGKELAKKVSPGRVIGYSDKPVKVFRHATRDDRDIIIELVNLAAPTAENEADALASRVLRIKEGPRGKNVEFLIGYIASPTGLNGEGVMKQWIEHKSGTVLLDVERECEKFRSTLSTRMDPLQLSLS